MPRHFFPFPPANPFFTAQLIFQQPLQLFPPPLQCDNLRAGGEAERRQLVSSGEIFCNIDIRNVFFFFFFNSKRHVLMDQNNT